MTGSTPGAAAPGAVAPRVALIGYGSAGRGIHAPLLAAAGAPPAVVATGSPQRREQVEADLPAAAVVPDLAAALDAGPDLVVLASPTGVHVENALQCIAAGVPLVVDKPLGVDAVGAGKVVAAAREARVALTVFQNRRWDAEQLTLARLLGDGELGAVHRFERRWERWRPVPHDRWRENADWRDGGGVLLDLGTHLVDSAVQLFGPVERVYADIAAWTTPADDEVFLALTHASGMRSHLGATSSAGAPGPRTRVLAERGAYLVTRFEAEHSAVDIEHAPGCTGWLVAGDDWQPVPTAPGGHGDFYPAVLAALTLTDATARQSAMPVDPADAVHTAAVLDAARRSAQEGRVVHVAEVAPQG